MSKEKFNPEKREKSYLLWGAPLFLLGVITTILNVALDVPDYQKISNFSVLFFTAGGAVMLIFGAPLLGSAKSPFLRKLKDNLWMIVTLAVFASFAALLTDATEGSNYMLVGLVVVAYVLFVGFDMATKSTPSQRAKVIETAEVLVVAIFLAIFIKGIGVQAFRIPSGSMLPTLQIGDQLLVSKFLYGIPLPYTDARVPAIREPERGDIVVFAYPGMDNPDRPSYLRNMLAPGARDDLKGEDFIKRVVGLPGDEVAIKGRDLYVNGERIKSDWGYYLDKYGKEIGVSIMPDIGWTKVPEGFYFVLGDNRNNSRDSRFWGFVSKDRIKGKAFIIYFSTAGLSRIGTTL